MYDKIFNDINELKYAKVVAIAVSGGVDSLSLTLIVNEWCKKNNIKLIGLTVDHLLRKNSTNEAKYVNSLLNEYGIEHHILTWEGEKPTTNIENIARDARYNLIFDFCKKNNVKVVLLGHHIQDQAENFLIRLFRGSGIEGLSSMKIVSCRDDFCLVRPFLNITKDELKKYLEEKNIRWIEDESNSDEKYLRNKIRTFLDSLPNKKEIINRINSTVEIFQTAEDIIEIEIQDLKNKIYIFDEDYKYYTINLDELFKINKELQFRILSKISKDVGGNKINPRFEKLERLFENIKSLKRYTFNQCVFEKIDSNQIVCYREYNSIKDKSNYLRRGELKDYLEFLKEKDFPKYKLIKDFKGYKKNILYTAPVLEFKNKKY